MFIRRAVGCIERSDEMVGDGYVCDIPRFYSSSHGLIANGCDDTIAPNHNYIFIKRFDRPIYRSRISAMVRFSIPDSVFRLRLFIPSVMSGAALSDISGEPSDRILRTRILDAGLAGR